MIEAIHDMKQSLDMPLFMETIIPASQYIWITRDEKMFHNDDTTFISWKRKFNDALAMVIRQAKFFLSQLADWLHHLV